MPPAKALIQWKASLPTLPPPAARSAFGRVLDWIVGDEPAPADGEGPLRRPFGVAVSGGGLLVADPDGHQVLRLTEGGTKLEPVVCPEQDWVLPMAVGSASGSIWVADGGAHRLVRVGVEGCSNVGVGALERPTAIAFLAGRVYTTDPPNHVVVGFSASGREELRFGVHGDGPDELNFPTALAVSRGGELLVVDALNFRVSRFTAEGKFAGSFGGPGDGEGAFGRPKGVAADGAGRIFVSDVTHDLVIVFEESGDFTFAFGGTGRGRGQLVMPAGVAVSGTSVYVADSLNGRIQEYELTGETR